MISGEDIVLINKVLLSYSIARINTNLYLLERALFKRFEPIQWVHIDVKRNYLDLRVIYVKIYLLVRAYNDWFAYIYFVSRNIF